MKLYHSSLLLIIGVVFVYDITIHSSISLSSSSSSSRIYYVDAITSTSTSSTTSIRTIIDRSGKVLSSSSLITDESTKTNGIVTIITSPYIPSILLGEQEDKGLVSILDKTDDDNDNTILICNGATLQQPSSSSSLTITNTGICISACSSISDVIVIEGITLGDVVNIGILNTRHGNTLSILFHNLRIQLTKNNKDSNNDNNDENNDDTNDIPKKQVLMLCIDKDVEDIDDNDTMKMKLIKDIQSLYQTIMIGIKEEKKKIQFDDIYDVQIIPISSSSTTTSTVLADAVAKAKDMSTESKSLVSVLNDAVRTVRQQNHNLPYSIGYYETPNIANAIATINDIYIKQSRIVRTKVMVWKSRISRGLLIDGYGKDATELRKRILNQYDLETIVSAGGINNVISYRYEMKHLLQSYIDTSIQECYKGQVLNLEKATVKRFNTELLKTVNSKESVESIMGNNAATMRKEALLFETVIEDIEVPDLGLTKQKPIRDLATKLNNALYAFPDSPAAKLKRLQQVTKIVNKEKEPGQRSISFGLDLVAMLRPDGFGSLQGFAGYQLPGGNSITFGIHNDADDPQVIAQFGGVRPPLLRVQPKLRVDVEM